MKLKKRGAVEIQFNWIFILIAGAIILLFFGSVIAKQKVAAEQKMSASLLVDIESILVSSSVTKQALNFVPIPQKEINFEKCSFYYIGEEKELDARLKKDIKEKVIFTPDLITGARLTMWTLPWDMPYRVTNFLYLTSPQVRYIIVADDFGLGSFADEIDKLLPPERLTIDEEEYAVMPREEKIPSELSDFTDLNNYKIKFIFLAGNPKGGNVDLSAFSGMKDNDVRAIKIDGNINDGDITFYKYRKSDNKFVEIAQGDEAKSKYLGKASLIGAIFAEDKEMYECAMQNAFERMRVVTDVYIKRTEAILAGASSDCMVYYGSEYSGALQDLYGIFDASTQFNFANIETIKLARNGLEAQNKNCPLIY